MPRFLSALLACSLAAVAVTGCRKPTTAASMYPSVEKHLAVTTTLGREIFRRDKLTWWAAQVVHSTLSPEQDEAIEGWVIDAAKPEADVLFLTRIEGELRVSYIVHCVGAGPEGCSIETLMTPAPLSEPNLAQFEASATAWDHPNFVQISDVYNIVVLPISDGPEDEWWVYLIAHDPNPNTVVLGQHYRFVVDASGATVRTSRRFAEGAPTIDLSEADAPPGARPTGISIEHPLDAVPTEMHVWIALQYQLELVVVTESEPGTEDPPLLWKVDSEGTIAPL